MNTKSMKRTGPTPTLQPLKSVPASAFATETDDESDYAIMNKEFNLVARMILKNYSSITFSQFLGLTQNSTCQDVRAKKSYFDTLCRRLQLEGKLIPIQGCSDEVVWEVR